MVRLTKILYNLDDQNVLISMQLVFSNNITSSRVGSQSGKMNTIEIPNSSTGRYISMRQAGHFFTGMRIRNDCGQLLVNEEWGEEGGEWVKH